MLYHENVIYVWHQQRRQQDVTNFHISRWKNIRFGRFARVSFFFFVLHPAVALIRLALDNVG